MDAKLQYLTKDENRLMKNRLMIATIIFPLIVLMVVILVRLPFLANPLIGEEGYFSILAISRNMEQIEIGTKFLLIAHIKDQCFFDNAEHPVIPYTILSKVMRKIFTFKTFSSLQLSEKSVVGRLPFLSLFLLAVFLICLIFGLSIREGLSEKLLMLTIFVFVLTSPLLVGGSIQPQIDGSIGVLLLSGAACCIILGFHLIQRKIGFSFFFLSGFFASIGKNEWFLSFFLSLFVSLFFYLFVTRYWGVTTVPKKKIYVSFLFAFGGTIAGIFLSYSADSYNFFHGLDVMLRFRSQSSQRSYYETFQSLIPWIWPLILMLLISWSLFLVRIKQMKNQYVAVLVILIWSSIMTGAYIMSRWIGDGFPRYFCPAMVLTSLCLLLLLQNIEFKKYSARLCILFCSLLICINCAHLLSFYSSSKALGSCPGSPLQDQELIINKIYEHGKKTKRPIWAPVTVYYYHPDLEFFEISLSKQSIIYIMKHKNTEFNGVRKKHRKLKIDDWLYSKPNMLHRLNLNL